MPEIPNIAFDPLVSDWLIILLGSMGFIAAILAGFGRLRSFLFRLLAMIALCAALLNPQTVEEDREPLKDEVLILKDESESQRLGNRAAYSDRIYNELIEKLGQDSGLEVTTATIGTDINGTQLTQNLIENLGNLPQNRLAGVIAITDGQVHDLPEDAASLLPDNVPFHSLIVDDPNGRDRRIRAIVAPRFGLVGEQSEFIVRVDDPGFEGERARIEIKLNGEIKARFPAIIGDQVSIPLNVEKRGINTIELTVEPVEGELTIKNNLFVSELSGIRDRMRVLLVTGEPHRGGRAWRNLLKSDPAVDLVHFTILTNPGTKFPNAREHELSLIRFPTRQLFEEKLDEFDLIIFDQFTRRQVPGRSGRATPILLPYYLQNIANYVENGGALLIATGPSFAGDNSLFRSALAAVLPARPTGEIAQYGFKPRLNDKGERHPVTAPFRGSDDQNWGRWFRIIESNVVSGDILMEGPGAEPLLVIERVGDGRVGMVMSDQAWLWARNFDNGGPYQEMFRRLAHWLLGEPDLDAEKIIARAEGETLTIERRTLTDTPQKVIVQLPDGSAETIDLDKISNGVYRAQIPADEQGAYRLSAGDVNTVAAIGALNPTEYSNLKPTVDILGQLSSDTGGLAQAIKPDQSLPDIRRVKATGQMSGDNWIGLVAHNDYVTRTSRRAPLAPGLLFFVLALLFTALAWRREGQ